MYRKCATEQDVSAAAVVVSADLEGGERGEHRATDPRQELPLITSNHPDPHPLWSQVPHLTSVRVSAGQVQRR